ncbi:MAG TPA: class I adenylate-forming enzyme family protein [Polyangiales bacterium]|nr:class I adenylate-forming enzyme family protein [Polyangiales bacterium]
MAGQTFATFQRLPRNLGQLYAETEPFDELEFLVHDDERISFREARRQAGNLAARLLDQYGVLKGDRVAIAMRNCPEWCLSFMAVTSIGAVVVPLNAKWQAPELEYGIRDTACRVAIVDGECLEKLRPVLGGLDVRVIVAREPAPAGDVVELSGLLSGDDRRPPDVDVAPDDDAMLLYTSGVSDKPKGVLSTHRAVLTSIVARELFYLAEFGRHLPKQQFEALVAYLNSRDGPSPGAKGQAVLIGLPLFHVTACNALFLPSLRYGRKIVLMSRWQPERALELIERERVTVFTGAPVMTTDLVSSPDFAKRDLRTLVHVTTGGARQRSRQAAEVKDRIGAAPGVGYGMTETNSVGTIVGGAAYVARPDSAGCLMPLVELKVIDEKGREVRPGCEGEICIKSVANMRGYWNRPDETARTLRDGWVHTGDLGHIDADGYVFITGRLKNLVIRGAEKISCAEVEKAIYEHPSVREAAAFGTPDERWGERLVAVVVPADGETLSVVEIDSFLATRVARFKIPARIIVLHELLPRLASGKIDVQALKSQFDV